MLLAYNILQYPLLPNLLWLVTKIPISRSFVELFREMVLKKKKIKHVILFTFSRTSVKCTKLCKNSSTLYSSFKMKNYIFILQHCLNTPSLNIFLQAMINNFLVLTSSNLSPHNTRLIFKCFVTKILICKSTNSFFCFIALDFLENY